MLMSTFEANVMEASPKDAYDAIQYEATAQLVDVRTRAEWSYVGVPMLGPRREPILLEWQSFPQMAVNPEFGPTLQSVCPDTSAPLYFLCRSGVRSHAAAQLMGSMGYANVFNVVDGFEGPPDENGHRGNRAGWKADGLPWRQT